VQRRRQRLEELGQIRGGGLSAVERQDRVLSERLTASCRDVDPQSTDQMIQLAHAADVVEGETAVPSAAPEEPAPKSTFGAGIFDD
jgi:hypothetical protein